MTALSFVFALEILPWDSEAEEDRGKEVVLWNPCLMVYSSPAVAAANEEGLHFVEGGLWFFAADGSPLAPKFLKEPYINQEKNTYFTGVYYLAAGAGDGLQSVLANRIAAGGSPHTRIVAWLPATDAAAREWGWLDAQTMSEGVKGALKILPQDLRERVVLEKRKAAKAPASEG